MFRLSAKKISLAASALLLCAGLAQAQTEPVSPLTAAPTSVALTYSLATDTPGSAVSVTITTAATAGNAFVIDPSSVPSWLSLNPMTGTAVPAKPGPAVTISFVANGAAATLQAGSYVASVLISVSGYQNLTVPVSLAVNAPSSVLTVSNAGSPVTSGSAIDLSYTYGSGTYPSATLTLLSSNDPISFAVTSAVTTPPATVDWIQPSATSGIAYSYGTGTTLTINFLSDIFANAIVGETFTGSMTLTYGSGQTFVVDFQISVTEPPAAITSIAPQEVAPQTAGAVTVVLKGSGFGSSTTTGFSANPSVVSVTYGPTGGRVTGAVLTSISGGTVTIPNQDTMILTIPFQDATPVAILTAGQTVVINVTNGLSGETAATITLYVTSNPIVSSLVDAGALVEAAPGVYPKVSPYEMVTIFGNNFCPTCTASVVPATVSDVYPTSVTAGGHALTVGFYQSDGATLIASAPILFANNTQINALVPSVVTAADDSMQVVVSYDAILSNATVATGVSFPYYVNAVAATPGILTTSSTGQGQAAIEMSNGSVYSVNSATNPAPTGSTVMIYLSGLGTPTSTASSATSLAYPGSCISPAAYATAESITTDDGAVIQSTALGADMYAPCFTTSPTVTIGGNSATVTYAGWVAGSVAGLYQINATVPTKATASNTTTLVVTVGSGTSAVSSQAGVTMAVK
jgi:uncharacterized protein (TIGR03437 family)